MESRQHSLDVISKAMLNQMGQIAGKRSCQFGNIIGANKRKAIDTITILPSKLIR